MHNAWQDFNWLKGSRGLSAAAELLVDKFKPQELRPGEGVAATVDTLWGYPAVNEDNMHDPWSADRVMFQTDNM